MYGVCPDDASLPKWTDTYEWYVQVEFDALHMIHGIRTKGQQGAMKGWVESYKVQVSRDCLNFAFVKQNGADKVGTQGSLAHFTHDLACIIILVYVSTVSNETNQQFLKLYIYHKVVCAWLIVLKFNFLVKQPF